MRGIVHLRWARGGQPWGAEPLLLRGGIYTPPDRWTNRIEKTWSGLGGPRRGREKWRNLTTKVEPGGSQAPEEKGKGKEL